MINLTKLIESEGTISEVIKKDMVSSLHFSCDKGPVVVWNITRECNLACKHCYIQADDQKLANELTTKEAKNFISDLATIKVPVLLFSGGEPLLRKDIFELGEFAANLGIHPVISTNGTLINRQLAHSIKDAGFVYVGVSIDGMEKIHNEFRGIKNGFQLALASIHHCMHVELATGIRFTVNKHNFDDLPALLDLAIKESIPRFCLYHLVYVGRGKEMIEDDISTETKIKMINFLISKAAGTSNMEILTVDNPVDGIYFYLEQGLSSTFTLLQMAGGCSAGEKLANVSPPGEIYPCQFWQDLSLGNVRNTPFSQIWQTKTDMIKQIKSNLKGKCGRCKYKEICSGCRVRAKVVYGDYLSEDPTCYLREEEISSCYDQTKIPSIKIGS